MARKRRSIKGEIPMIILISFAVGIATSLVGTAIYNVATTGKLELKLPFLSS